MHIDFIDSVWVKQNYYDRFPMCVEYINRDKMYCEKWIHLTNDDYTNDAFIYIMPSETHNIQNGIWISVLEVGDKGKGFGHEVISYVSDIAKKLGKNCLALHALNKTAKLFYISNSFTQLNDEDDMILNIK